MQKKIFSDVRVTANEALGNDLLRICLERCDGKPMPMMTPGQFVELQISGAKVLLNRPISVMYCTDSCLTLLVRMVGEGTRALESCRVGDTLRIVGPLGRSFSLVENGSPLLIGGGVGIAPLYFLAKAYAEKGVRPVVVYGERSKPVSFIEEIFADIADLKICTDDGSYGFHGLVTQHPCIEEGEWSLVQTCGPMPMMKAVAGVAAKLDVECEVSLENRMACGLGACLCCVEDTKEGHKCVCTDGPVFNVKELKWQI